MAAFRCRKTLASHAARRGTVLGTGTRVRRFVISQRREDTQNDQVLEAMPFKSYTVD